MHRVLIDRRGRPDFRARAWCGVAIVSIRSIDRSTDFDFGPNRCINDCIGAAILEEEGVTGLEAIKGKIERLNFPGVAVNFGSVDVQSSIDGALPSIVGADERRDDDPVTPRLIQIFTFTTTEQAAC